MKTTNFQKLALGTRFSYPDKPERIFVKLCHSGTIAEWDAKNIDTSGVGQGVYSVGDSGERDVEVVIQEK